MRLRTVWMGVRGAFALILCGAFACYAHAGDARPRPIEWLIPFAPNAQAPTDASRADIATLARLMNDAQYRDDRFIIEGHTDARGSREYNLALSLTLATVVRDHLIQAGVASERLEVVGYGEEQPIDPKAPYGAANRRVYVHEMSAP